MPRGADSAAKGFLYSSVVWLAAGASALALAGVKLVAPEFLTTELVTFGKLRAAASVFLIYGWLTQGALAAIFYVVPRTTGARIRSEVAGGVSGMLGSLAVFLTAVTIFFGGVSGKEFLELPKWAAAILVVSLAIAAAEVLRAIVGKKEVGVHPSLWFFAGAVVWAPLSLAAGTLPAFSGARDSIVHLFAINSFLHLWIGTAALGALYYIVPRASGAPLYSQRLALIGFWWFAFTAPLAGQSRLMFGPAPDWLETASVAASIAMLASVLAHGVNFLATLKGSWARISEFPSIRFALGGYAVWAAALTVGCGLSFRSVAQILGATDAVVGQVLSLVVGLTLMISSSIIYSFPRLMGRSWVDSTKLSIYFWITITAVLLIGTGTMAAGLTEGTVFRVGVATEHALGTGSAFELVLRFANKFRFVTMCGLVAFAAGQLLFARNVFQTTVSGEWRAVEIVAEEESEPQLSEEQVGSSGSSLLIAPLALGIFLISSAIAYAAPLADSSLSRKTNYTINYSKQMTSGKNIYESEGCWYCHTQSVRPVFNDLGLGKATTPARIANDDPSVLGLARIGPDLACVGDRFDDQTVLSDYLRSPRTHRPFSTMPPLAYLSDSQIEALAAYLLGLSCG